MAHSLELFVSVLEKNIDIACFNPRPARVGGATQRYGIPSGYP
jgi:hypothetical protein